MRWGATLHGPGATIPTVMHIRPAVVVLLLTGCVGEAEWALGTGPQVTPETPTTPVEVRARMTSFQGLSSGLPASANPHGIAHLDGTVYLVVDGQLFSLASAAKEWTVVALPLNAAEKVTSISRVDLSLYLTTTDGLLRLDWGKDGVARLAGAPAGGVALLKKGSELLLATSAGLFASSDKGVTFKVRSPTAALTVLVGSSAAQRIFGVVAFKKLMHSDDAGATWTAAAVTGEVQALAAAGAYVLVQTAVGTQRSGNYGNTFKAATVGAQPFSFGFSGTRVFAGTMTGVRVSDDGGAVWRDGNEGLPPSTQVKSLWVAGPAVIAATATQLFVAELF